MNEEVMDKEYENALEVFSIDRGFVEEQIPESLYVAMDNASKIKDFKKNQEYIKAYLTLSNSLFQRYILGPIDIRKEEMELALTKFIYDSYKRKSPIDENFVAKIVEIVASARELNDYIKDIAFGSFSSAKVAVYKNQTLTIYLNTMLEYINRKISDNLQERDKTFLSYLILVRAIAHEVEHAMQQKYKDLNNSDIKSVLLRACDTYSDKYDQMESSSQKSSIILLTPILDYFKKRKAEFYNETYLKNWNYSPKEKMAELKGLFTALKVGDTFEKERLYDFSNIKGIIEHEINTMVFYGYDKVSSPADYYLKQLKLHKARLEVARLSENLSLEERLELGLQITPEELEYAKSNKTLVLQQIQNNVNRL